MSLLAAMDRFVHITRLDLVLRIGRPRPRNLRWLPVLPFAAMAAGYVLATGFRPGSDSLQLGFLGVILFMLGYFCTCLVWLFGPRVSLAEQLDERERAIRARAGNFSFFIVTGLVTAGCFYGAYAAVFGSWMPANALEWSYLGLFFQASALALPAWTASWLQPNPGPEDY